MSSVSVYKFGGTSVGDANRIRSVADIVSSGPDNLVVVSSAMSGVTNWLVAVLEAIDSGKSEVPWRTTMQKVEARYRTAFDALTDGMVATGDRWSAIQSVLDDLQAIFSASSTLGEVTDRARDRVLASGEKMAVHLVALAIEANGRPSQPMYADDFLVTDGVHGQAFSTGALTDRAITAALKPLLDQGIVPVVTGYCGCSADGHTVTLGRGGSDLSATIIGAGLNAAEVTLWSDVAGVFTTDPKLVRQARVIPHLHYREAAEMSFYGAKVLHQRTMIPVTRVGIPVRCRSTLEPEAIGTVIDSRFSTGGHPVKACSAISGQTLISVEGKGMAGVTGIAGRLFSALADADVSLTMICQSSSEASIAFVVPAQATSRAVTAVRDALAVELARGEVEDIHVDDGMDLVAVVGLGMAQTPGIAMRVFKALASRKINAYAIAQGASELNISVAIKSKAKTAALDALHEEFGLDRIDTGVETHRHLDLVLLGFGQISRRLLGIVRAQAQHVEQRFGLVVRVVGLADRSGYLLAPTGFSEKRLDMLVQAKAAGRSLAEQGGIPGSLGAAVSSVLRYRLAHPIVVDVTDEASNGDVLADALAQGADVVTANKGPLADSAEGFQRLMGRAGSGRLTRGEATVGAGLPILDTIEMLVGSGDRLLEVQGCLSGTLGFITDALGAGQSFSDAVKAAHGNGYTEPDPAIDLSGMDVARKAMIIARMAGWSIEPSQIKVTGLVPDNWMGLNLNDLWSKVEGLDDEFARRVKTATAQGAALRYSACVTPERIEVGLVNASADSPLLGLRGTDKMVIFKSSRYAVRPLVILGPGAGADVTAMGVFSDILRIAAERIPGHG
ncbi:MAG: aspartate kinase [Myxococcota bacterium]|nr:aspartate kinase [Myxococcota bacterium]